MELLIMKNKLQILFILLGIFGLYSCNNDDNSDVVANELEGIWSWENYGSYIMQNNVVIDSTVSDYPNPNRNNCMKQKRIQFTDSEFLENHLVFFDNGCEFRTMKFPYNMSAVKEFKVNTGNFNKTYKYKKISENRIRIYYFYAENGDGTQTYDFDTYKRVN